MKVLFFVFFLISSHFYSYSQTDNWSVLSIPDSLKENANAVVRFNQTVIDLQSEKQMLVTIQRTITVLNRQGEKYVKGGAYYDKSTKIKELEAVFFDSFGNEIKRIKRKDFKDRSVADGFSVFTDDRVAYLDYSPLSYPYTVVVNKQIETSNTARFYAWEPIEDYYVAIIKDEFLLKNHSNIGIGLKENYLDRFPVLKKNTSGTLRYVIENIPAVKYEDLAPSLEKTMPSVKFNLEKFSFESVEGKAKNWEEYGKWYYDNLIFGTEELSEETKSKIKNLVGVEKNPLNKAKILYKYMQDKSRYVSVQIGIGGWKPMLAKDVDRLGYGDCKALSNYLRSLLEVVGVQSYLTLIKAGPEKNAVFKDFVYDDFNHMILTLPYEGKNYFLECTSQTAPFNFQGTFTDDRYALLLKPEGGELIKTANIEDDENLQTTIGNYEIFNDGGIKAKLLIKTKGVQYDRRNELEKKAKEELTGFYKENWSHINNLVINKISLENNKNEILFSESIDLEAAEYASLLNGQIIFAVNAFNINDLNPKRYRKRVTPFEIMRGYNDVDEIEVKLPKEYQLENLPKDVEVKSKFGMYKVSYQKKDNDYIVYKRILKVNRGEFQKEEYSEFRNFLEQITKFDNTKIVLLKR